MDIAGSAYVCTLGGASIAQDGVIRPEHDRPGRGLTFKTTDAAPFLV